MFTPQGEARLPHELLLAIFHHLDNDELVRLTDVSPCFCHLSLLVYFAKRRIAISPSGQIDLPNVQKTKEMLPLIPKARFVTSINRLSCVLVHPPITLLQSISDLTAVLKKVERVEELVIDFLMSGEGWSSALIKQANASNGLFKGLTELFMAATHVAYSISIRNGGALKDVMQKAERAAMLRRKISTSFNPVSRLLSQSSSNNLKKKSSIHSLVAAANDALRVSISVPVFNKGVKSAKGAVHALNISSDILLSPPFLDWTIQTLNSNDITVLTFGTIEFRDVEWSSFLPQIYLPALKHLTFRGLTPFIDLVNFMSRHQKITQLMVNTIDFEDWTRPSVLESSSSAHSPTLLEKLSTAFTHLKKLACCPQGLVGLLSGALHPTNPHINLFPNLRCISVLWSLGLGQHFRVPVVRDILKPIADKLRTFEKAIFVIMYRVDVGSSWLACPPLPLLLRRRPSFFRPVTSSNNIHIPNHYGALTAVESPSDATPEASLFSVFTEVRLEVTPRADRDGVPALIQALAEAFTHVRQFKVDMRSRAGRSTQENKLMKLYLCHHILNHFVQLRAVYVDGVRSKVVQKGG